MLCTGFPAMLDALAMRRNSLRACSASFKQAAASQRLMHAARAAKASALLGTSQARQRLGAHTLAEALLVYH